MDLQWIPDAYEAANGKDFSELAARVSPQYRHHVPSLGIEWDGWDAALQGLRESYAAMQLTQSAVDVAQHGPFVTVSITGRSNLRPEPFEAVHVFRVEDDRFVECWGHYPSMA